MFRDKSAQSDKRRKYYPIVIQADCMNPNVANYGYTCFIYMEFNIATA